MNQFLGLSQETWGGVIIGSVVAPFVWWLIIRLRNWWINTRPQNQLFGALRFQEGKCQIFVRDFQLSPGSTLLATEPRLGTGIVQNIDDLWADVDGKATANVLNALGQVGKTKNIEIVRMSQDTGQWNSHVIIIGGQNQKAFDFYSRFKYVMYNMNSSDIYDKIYDTKAPWIEKRRTIHRENGFGYGIILKAHNPFKTEGDGIGFLIGGFGTLGTVIASNYFREHFKDLGREFGSRCFGIVVRAPVTAGEEAVERLYQHDKVSCR